MKTPHDESGASSGPPTVKTAAKRQAKPPAPAKGERRSPATEFKAGARPGPGRPKLPDDVKEAFRRLSVTALKKLEQIIENDEHPRQEQAIEYAINRVHGQPKQPMELTGPDGQPVKQTLDVTVTLNSEQKLKRAAELLAKAMPDGAAKSQAG